MHLKGFQNIEHLQLYKMHCLTTEPQAPPTGLFYQQQVWLSHLALWNVIKSSNKSRMKTAQFNLLFSSSLRLPHVQFRFISHATVISMVYLYMASIFNISVTVFWITEKHKKLLLPNQLKSGEMGCYYTQCMLVLARRTKRRGLLRDTIYVLEVLATKTPYTL